MVLHRRDTTASVAALLAAGAIAFSVQGATAAPVRLQITGDLTYEDTLDFSNTATGTYLFDVTYDVGQATFDQSTDLSGNFLSGRYDPLAASLTLIGGPGDGFVYSEASGFDLDVQQGTSNGGASGDVTYSFNGPSVPSGAAEGFSFGFGLVSGDVFTIQEIEATALIFGEGYLRVGPTLFKLSSTSSSAVAPIPLPASGALLALAAGGLALRAAAKKRRVARGADA